MQRDSTGYYIIGGGISGLVWGFYNPDFQIITPKETAVGESFTRTYLVWLHDSPETRKLLKDLDLPIIPKKSKIGYYQGHWICDSQSPEMNRKMIQKKMTEWDKEIDTSFVPKTDDLSLTKQGGNSYLLSLDVDLTEVIKRLSKNARIIYGYVTGINDKKLTVRDNFESPEYHVYYEELVSTIAAPFFWKAYGEEKEFKCLPITNVITSVKPKEFNDAYEMVYYGEEVPFTRVSHLGNKYALEFSGVITKEAFEKLYPELTVDDYFVVKQGRIFENEGNISPSKDITFSGRFAEWKYGRTTEHVVDQAQNYK